jgi:hypothetical protein
LAQVSLPDRRELGLLRELKLVGPYSVDLSGLRRALPDTLVTLM